MLPIGRAPDVPPQPTVAQPLSRRQTQSPSVRRNTGGQGDQEGLHDVRDGQDVQRREFALFCFERRMIGAYD